jgi:hypothetical protein
MLHLWSLFLFQKAGQSSLTNLKGPTNSNEIGSMIKRAREAHDLWINDYLVGARTREYWIEHKARLLRQPLLGSSGPPYLLGYLAIKRAYLVLRRVNPGLSDSDIFLLVMNGYWFSDPQTTKLLVRVEDRDVMSVQYTIGEYVERFQDMWDGLYKGPGKIAQRVLEDLGRQDLRRSDLTGSIELMIGLRTAADSLNFFVPKFFKHRLVLRLGMIRVNIVSNEETRIASVRDSKTGQELLQCPLVKLADTGEFPGSIEIVRTYDGSVTALVVLGGTGLVAVRPLFSERWNEPELTSLFDDLPSLELVEASAQAYRQSPFARRWDHEDFREVNEFTMNQARELTVSSYLQLVLRGQQKKQRSSAAEKLEASGFAGLFPDQAELDELALLSLHFGGPGESIDCIANRLNRTPQTLTSSLSNFNERSRSMLGMDLFELEGGRATSAV